jgi:hypothetical protein
VHTRHSLCPGVTSGPSRGSSKRRRVLQKLETVTCIRERVLHIRAWKKPAVPAAGARSVLLGLVARAVLDPAALERILDVLRHAPTHARRIHPAHVFCCARPSAPRKAERAGGGYAHVRCQRATQLVSGLMTAMRPSQCVVVHDAMRSCEPRICVRREPALATPNRGAHAHP